MKVTLVQRRMVLVFAGLLGGAVWPAEPPDPQLLSLVPSDSQIVAGTAAPRRDHHRGSFLIFTRASTSDLADFFSIVGGDASHKIYQVIFAASARHGYADPEHSLLVSGDFDARRIYMSAISAESASTPRVYHGVSVVVLPPFERERAILKQDRWLAILDSHLAIFGTVASAQQEIDRFLSGAAADASIAKMLSSLQNADDTWCLISSLVFGPDIPRVLRKLDPAFGEIDQKTDSILFGIKYGRQVQFEYVVNALPEMDSVPTPPAGRPLDVANPGLSLTSDTRPTPGNGFRRIVKIPRARFERWLDGLTAR